MTTREWLMVGCFAAEVDADLEDLAALSGLCYEVGKRLSRLVEHARPKPILVLFEFHDGVEELELAGIKRARTESRVVVATDRRRFGDPHDPATGWQVAMTTLAVLVEAARVAPWIALPAIPVADSD